MLRIYARLLAAALIAMAVVATVRIPNEGLGVSVLYVGSAAVFAYAGFRRGDATLVRSVVAAMGSLFLASGLLLALAMGVVGFPLEGRYWVVGLAHAALGGVTMACAVLLPCEDDGGPPPARLPPEDFLGELRPDGFIRRAGWARA
jgi:hypothetical protein